MLAPVDPGTLRAIPLFSGMSDAELLEIQPQLRRRSFPEGTNVIAIETPGDVVYVILTGTVKIKIDRADGTEVIVAILGSGDIVGELSLLDDVPRSADVLTQEQSTLAWLDRAGFTRLRERYPAISVNLLKILSRRLRLATEQIQALCTLDVYGRVARQISAFSDVYGVEEANGIRIPMRLTQSDIAGMVGASRERVNQQIGVLKRKKLISIDATYRITVLNPDKLRAIADER